ncbi:MAG: glycosyl transferase family 2 [Dokdonia sp.]|jgi:glycosyltransferase involved in cell wall biosynthesis
MRTIKELKAKLNPKNGFQTRYNLEADDKIHLLYVSPKMNATGYYRMIAPALEINKTTTHKAIITSIENNDFSSNLTEMVHQLDERLITWADYIIFPSLFADVSYLFQAIKILNPSVQLVMDVDRNYFAMLNEVTLSRKLTKEKLKHFENNLGLMDIVTVGNRAHKNFLQRLINDRLEKANAIVQFIPSYISRFGYEEMPAIQKNEQQQLRVGLLKPDEDSLLSLKEVFIQLKSSFKDKIQFVCLGKPHSSKEGTELLKEINCDIHNTVSFTDYFEKLNGLELDIAVLPAKEGLYNRHKNYELFYEFSVFGIPVIASIHHPAKAVIKDGETGLLAGEAPEWVSHLTELANDRETLKQIAKNALKSGWKYHSYSASNLESMLEIFI